MSETMTERRHDPDRKGHRWKHYGAGDVSCSRCGTEPIEQGAARVCPGDGQTATVER